MGKIDVLYIFVIYDIIGYKNACVFVWLLDLALALDFAQCSDLVLLVCYMRRGGRWWGVFCCVYGTDSYWNCS